MLCFQDFHDWTILREFLIQICWPWTGQQNILRQHELVMNVFWARITKRRSKRASFCWDIWKLLWCQHVRGEESLVQNRKVWFARRNISGLCRRLGMSSLSGNTKRGSKGVSGCRETASSHPVAFHRNSQFSRQPLAAFKYRFDFSDLPNTLDHLQRPKTFRSANLRLRFPRQVAFCHALDFHGNFRLSQRQ
jgi:hypothetical protein